MSTWPNLPATASTAETVWTAATAFGLLLAAMGAVITTANLQAARRAHRRARQAAPVIPLHLMIAWQAVRNETLTVAVLVLLVVVLALFVAVGVLAMLTPPPLRPEVQRLDMVATAALIVGVIAVAVVTALLTAGSLLNRRDRHAVTNRITGRLLREEMERRARAAASAEKGPLP